MSLSFFQVERGFSIDGSVEFITGTGIPGASGDATIVGVGSLYMEDSSGAIYKKITAGAGTANWQELADALGLSAVQTEVDNIEASLGSSIAADGTFVAFTGTNQVDAATSVTNAITLLDSSVGAQPTAVGRTNNPITGVGASNANIDALDAAIGADTDVTSSAYISTTSTLLANLSALDAAIQSSISGLDSKASVLLATTADLDTIGNGTWVQAGAGVGATLTAGAVGTTTVDGVALLDGDRVLVKDQTLAEHNGIYDVSASDVLLATILTRSLDFDGSPANEVTPNAYTFAETGTANADKGFVVVTNGTITVDTTPINWSVFSSAGGLGAIQTELDAFEASAGTAIAADGTFAGYLGTNHIDGATSLTNADELLDAEIGANFVGVTRTNNPVTGSGPAKTAISALDAAVGADTDLTPVARTTGPAVVANTLMTNLDALDTAIGVDVTPILRTIGATVATNSVNVNIDALDSAIGVDVTPQARTNNPISVANSVTGNIDALDTAVGADTDLTPVLRTTGQLSVSLNLRANLDALDTAIGVDVTPLTRTNNSIASGNNVNANIDALDSAIGADTDVLSTDIISLSNSIMANLSALDAAVNSVGVQTKTVVPAITATTVDEVLVDVIVAVQWLIHIRDGANMLVGVVEATHDNIPAGADAANTDHSFYAKLRIGSVAGATIAVDLNGVGAAQTMRLRVTTTNGTQASVMRFGIEA